MREVDHSRVIVEGRQVVLEFAAGDVVERVEIVFGTDGFCVFQDGPHERPKLIWRRPYTCMAETEEEFRQLEETNARRLAELVADQEGK